MDYITAASEYKSKFKPGDTVSHKEKKHIKGFVEAITPAAIDTKTGEYNLPKYAVGFFKEGEYFSGPNQKMQGVGFFDAE